MVFVVGTVGVTETGDTHREPTGVPGVGNLSGVGGEGSEDVGNSRGIGGDVMLERGGKISEEGSGPCNTVVEGYT